MTGEPKKVHTVGQSQYFEYEQFENVVANIAYGTIVKSRQQVSDFLVSYQRYPLSKGFVFDGITSRGERNDFIILVEKNLDFGQIKIGLLIVLLY